MKCLSLTLTIILFILLLPVMIFGSVCRLLSLAYITGYFTMSLLIEKVSDAIS